MKNLNNRSKTKIFVVSFTSKNYDKLKNAKTSFTEFCSSLKDFVLLRTCQRVEIYTKNEISLKYSGCKRLSGEEARKHIESLGAGIYSELIGEIEIFLQMKEAILRSRLEEHLSKELEYILSKFLEESISLREKRRISTSWPIEVSKILSSDERIIIWGGTTLAKRLINFLKEEGFENLKDVKEEKDLVNLRADTLILCENISLAEQNAFSNFKKVIDLIGNSKIKTRYSLNYFYRKRKSELVMGI